MIHLVPLAMVLAAQSSSSAPAIDIKAAHRLLRDVCLTDQAERDARAALALELLDGDSSEAAAYVRHGITTCMAQWAAAKTEAKYSAAPAPPPTIAAARRGNMRIALVLSSIGGGFIAVGILAALGTVAATFYLGTLPQTDSAAITSSIGVSLAIPAAYAAANLSVGALLLFIGASSVDE